MLVRTFCFANGEMDGRQDELPPTREKFSHGLISGAPLNDSRMIDGATHSDRFRNDRGLEKAFNG